MRKRVFIILLLPMIILLWVIGWSLFWTGSKASTGADQPASKTDVLETTIVPLEECTAE